MSELINKQKALELVAFAMLDDIPDLQKLHDDILEVKSEPMNEEQAWKFLSEQYKVGWRRMRNVFETIYFTENGDIPVLINQPQLNENQQIVLDAFKKEYQDGELFPLALIYKTMNADFSKKVRLAYVSLSRLQEAQVLQSFTTWMLEQEESE